ncbi:glutamyl-tRNA(Gln) amidotransferase subunit C, mitochondrial isoform 1-T1 [Aulostomus maculatus]
MSAYGAIVGRKCCAVSRNVLRPSFHRGYSTVNFHRGRNLRCQHTNVTRRFSSQPHNHEVPKAEKKEPAAEDQLLQPAQVSADLVDKLERLALVDFRTKQGLACLERAIRFADQLHDVDTSGVKPMDSVLEDRVLHLRDDVAMEGGSAEVLLQLSKITVEEYFVAPPGNIPPPNREERAAMLEHTEV